MTGPPEPMVNAMAGLRLLDNSNKKLIMINHKTPGGLFLLKLVKTLILKLKS